MFFIYYYGNLFYNQPRHDPATTAHFSKGLSDRWLKDWNIVVKISVDKNSNLLWANTIQFNKDFDI